MAKATDVIIEAMSHKGYKETGNNVNKFGAWYGMNGAAWCAIFVSYCMNKAGAGALIKGAATAKGTARVSDFMRHAQKHKWPKVNPADAKAGDIVIFDFPGGYETDHVGLIRSASKGKNIYTIEGNTSSGTGSQSNGGGVFPRTRSFGTVHSIWRPPYDPEVATPAPVAPANAVIDAPVSPVEAPTPVEAPVTAKPAFTPVGIGSKRSVVKGIQTKVGATADGVFGPKTEEAVKAWQLKKGLPVTGIVDEVTYKRMGL